MIQFPRLVVPSCACVALFAVSLWPLAPAPAFAAPPDDSEMEELYGAVQDSARALPAEQRLRQALAEDPKAPMCRHLITLSLISRRVPTDEFVAFAESTIAALRPTGNARQMYFGTVLRELVARRERLDLADSLARVMVQSTPDDLRASTSLLHARVFDARGMSDSVVALLAPLAGRHPDEAELFQWLGRAHEHLGHDDEAMAAYARAAGIWLAPDTTVLAPLRALGAKRGLDDVALQARLKEERRASHQRIVLETPRADRPAPRWAGRTLNGRRVRDRDYSGRIVVLKFWGTWCAPCLATLPDFQEFYSDTLPPGVVLLTVNREYEFDSGTRARVQALVRERAWTFPVIFDSTGTLARSFDVSSYPTTVIIDRSGRIRYVDQHELRGQYLARRQVQALLEERDDRGRTPRAIVR